LTGISIERSGYDFPKAASEARQKYIEQMRLRKSPEFSITLFELIQGYISDYEIPNNRHSTVVKTTSICNKHAVSLLGEKKYET
jgi:hypothetical protein